MLPEPLRMPLGNIQLPSDNGITLVQAINDGQLLGASDGSVTTSKGQTTGGHSYSLRHWNMDRNKLIGYVPTPYST